MRFKEYIKSELTGWKAFDIAWFSISTAVILGLSIYWGDSILGIASALTGVWCVILTGMGKRSTFIFGTINVLCYAYISFTAKYYGEVMLNMLYYFPMNFVGWFAWKKHMNEETGQVVKKHLNAKNSVLVYGAIGIAIFLYGIFLKKLGGKLPYIDSMSTVVSVAAQILSTLRLTEQWILWIVVDIVTVIMWGINFAQGQENISVLLMWSIYLINAFIMYFRWNKEAKSNEI